MTIEITSVPESRGRAFRRKFKRVNRNFRVGKASYRRIVLQSIATLLLLATIAGSDSLLRSYKYYSKLVDARLASGYLTSRPGLYAAPRTLRVGQGFSAESLVNVLRRAGYIETSASEVWSGSFTKGADTVEIRPRRDDKTSEPRIVRIRFSDERILELTGDELALEDFTLEPEVLTTNYLRSPRTQDLATKKFLPYSLMRSSPLKTPLLPHSGSMFLVWLALSCATPETTASDRVVLRSPNNW